MVCITSSKLFTTSVLPLMMAVCRGLKNQYKIVGFITFSFVWYNSFLIDRLSDIMYLSQAMKKVIIKWTDDYTNICKQKSVYLLVPIDNQREEHLTNYLILGYDPTFSVKCWVTQLQLHTKSKPSIYNFLLHTISVKYWTMIQVIKLSTIHNTQPTSIWSGLRNIEQKWPICYHSGGVVKKKFMILTVRKCWKTGMLPTDLLPKQDIVLMWKAPHIMPFLLGIEG